MVRRRPQEFQRPACGFRGAAARYPCWGSERGGKGCGRQGRLKRGLIGVECWRSWWGGGGEEMEGNRCGHKKDAGEFVYRYANIAAYSIPSQNRSTPLLFISPNFKASHSISIYHQPLSPQRTNPESSPPPPRWRHISPTSPITLRIEIDISCHLGLNVFDLVFHSILSSFSYHRHSCTLIQSLSSWLSENSCQFLLDWPRLAGSSSSSRVPGPPRPDSGQNFGIKYSGRVTMLVSSIDPDSRPGPPRHEAI